MNRKSFGKMSLLVNEEPMISEEDHKVQNKISFGTNNETITKDLLEFRWVCSVVDGKQRNCRVIMT